jgi:hypothetical protein
LLIRNSALSFDSWRSLVHYSTLTLNFRIKTIGIMYNLSNILISIIPFDGNIFSSLNNSLDWNHFDYFLRYNLRNILFNIFYGIIVNFSDLPGNLLNVFLLFIFDDFSLHRDPLNPLSDLIINDFLLKWNILNSTMS